MSSYRTSLYLCRAGRQTSIRVPVRTWHLASQRKCLSTQQTPVTVQDKTADGDAFESLMSRLEEEYSGRPPVPPQDPVKEPLPQPTEKTTHQAIESASTESSTQGFPSPRDHTDGSPKKTSSEPNGHTPRIRKTRNRHEAKPSPSEPFGKETSQKDYNSAVRVDFKHSDSYHYDPLFLRDCCACPKCVDQSTRQKLFSTTDISPNIRVRNMWQDADVTHFTWNNDLSGFGPDHVTSIAHTFLQRSVTRTPVPTYRTGKRLWAAAEFEANHTTFDYEAYMSDDRVFFEALRQLHRYGLVFVRGVPNEEPFVAAIANRIGPLKNTFYGPTWNVRSVAQAKNVAYTAQDLGFHMDLLYMHQPPRIQLLHCLKASDSGGISLFSDSYLAAEKLFQRDRASFDALTDHNVNFHYDNDSQHLHQSRRVIQLVGAPLDPNRKSIQGLLDAVNWSPPFQGPFHSNIDDRSLVTQVRQWHKAAQAFRDLVETKTAVYERQMPPGECVIFDNRRVLHARTAFSGGERWLRGCYIDSDPLLSKMRVLSRQYGSPT